MQKKYISWVTVELLRILNYNKKTLDEVEIKPEHLAELIRAVSDGKITVLKAKQVMNEFIPKSFSLKEKAGEVGKVSDSEVESICKKVILENEKSVTDYKAGKKEALNFLIGQVMKLSNRRADFNSAKECLIKLL